MRSRSFIIFAFTPVVGFIIGLTAVSHRSGLMRLSQRGDISNHFQDAAHAEGETLPHRSSVRVEAEAQSLLDQARSAGAGSLAAAELQRAVDRWLLADPVACITWLHDRGASGLVSRELFPDVFTSALGGDLVLAIRAGGEISDPVLRSAWLRSIFEVAKETEPEHALKLLTFLPPKMEKEIAKDVISTWAAKDGPAAWRAVLGGKRPDNHALAAAALHAWAEADPSAAHEFIRLKLENPGRGQEKALFFSAMRDLATRDTSQVLIRSLAGLTRDPALQKIWMEAVASAAEGTAESTLQIIDREPPGIRRDAARAEFAKRVVRTDLARGLEIAATLPAYASRRAIFEAAVSDLIEKRSKPEEAAVLAQGQSEWLLRSELMAVVTSRWLAKDRTSFLQFVFAQPESVSERWLDGIAKGEFQVYGEWAPAGSQLSEAERARLQRELAARLPPAKAATLMQRLLER